MTIARQLTVMLENRPGKLAELASELARVAVNISALMLIDVKPVGPVRMVVSNPEAARKVCGVLGLTVVEENVLAIKVSDKPGALGKITRKLAEKGINVEYAYGSIVKGADRALIVLGVSDLPAAEKVLG
ncbi:MAG TPA: ACT domain-containing protein [Candidatus Acidoferrales bacterium]